MLAKKEKSQEMSLELDQNGTWIQRTYQNGKTNIEKIGWKIEHFDEEEFKQSRKYKTSYTLVGKILWKYIQMTGVLVFIWSYISHQQFSEEHWHI